jgi:hypothetical protein
MTSRIVPIVTMLLSFLGTAEAQAQDDMQSFLVQSNLDGTQLLYDQQFFIRRHDWGGSFGPNVGWQTSDSAIISDHTTIVQTWSYGPNLHFIPSQGDGGQIISLIGSDAVFSSTQDGSYNGIQYFVGPGCGGQEGWLLFDTSAMHGPMSWVSRVSHLSLSRDDPTACPPLGSAFTRWQRGMVGYVFQMQGNPIGMMALDTILTEHYDNVDQASSVNMERNFFAKGFGNLRWEAWSKDPNHQVGNDLANRCPANLNVNGYYYVEDPSWHIVDCRFWTNFAPATPLFSVATYGWHGNLW